MDPLLPISDSPNLGMNWELDPQIGKAELQADIAVRDDSDDRETLEF